jgi:hypothetical protein
MKKGRKERRKQGSKEARKEDFCNTMITLPLFHVSTKYSVSRNIF